MHCRRLFLAATLLSGLTACATGQPPARGAQTVVLFFTADSAAIDENGQEIIREAAEIAQERQSAAVRVRGFAANDAGSPGFNAALSQARAQKVADGLVAAGLPQARVHIEYRGGVPFRDVPTESRRVEIVIGN